MGDHSKREVLIAPPPLAATKSLSSTSPIVHSIVSTACAMTVVESGLAHQCMSVLQCKSVASQPLTAVQSVCVRRRATMQRSKGDPRVSRLTIDSGTSPVIAETSAPDPRIETVVLSSVILLCRTTHLPAVKCLQRLARTSLDRVRMPCGPFHSVMSRAPMRHASQAETRMPTKDLR